MDEFALIHQFFRKDGNAAGVAVGIGDDGAVLLPTEGRELVSVVDTSVANIHFPADLAPAKIAYRAVAVNLSDLAAMAATPRWMLLALTMPQADPAWLAEFARGLFDAASEHDVALVGGDTTRGRELVISVHMLGEVEPQKSLTRSAAKPGDHIWISGSTGDAAAGLRLLQEQVTTGNDVEILRQRFCRPTARVDLALSIAAFATAAIDISDGLYADLQKLAECSNVAALLQLEKLPLSEALRNVFPDEARRLAMTGGDDYELCFTASSEDAAAIVSAGDACGVSVSAIGEIVEIGEANGVLCSMDGDIVPFDDAGFRHFEE